MGEERNRLIQFRTLVYSLSVSQPMDGRPLRILEEQLLLCLFPGQVQMVQIPLLPHIRRREPQLDVLGQEWSVIALDLISVVVLGLVAGRCVAA